MFFNSYKLFTFLSREEMIALLLFNWGSFVCGVGDNGVFPQSNFPFLVEVTATFLLLKVDQPGNYLISLKNVDMSFE